MDLVELGGVSEEFITGLDTFDDVDPPLPLGRIVPSAELD